MEQRVIVLLGHRITPLGTMSHILYERCAHLARVYAKAPCPVILTGGVSQKGYPSEASFMLSRLVELGVPQSDMILEEQSLTTKQNAELCAPILQQMGVESVELLSSPSHLHRKYLNPTRLFRKYAKGVKVTAVPDFVDCPDLYLANGFSAQRETLVLFGSNSKTKATKLAPSCDKNLFYITAPTLMDRHRSSLSEIYGVTDFHTENNE